MKRFGFFVTALFVMSAPLAASAADFGVSGWIPYWAAKDGARDAVNHLDTLTSVYPFSYSISTDGKPKDLADMKGSNWKKLLRDARAKGIPVIPTIMWSDTQNIHKILSSQTLRAKHVAAIADLVKTGKYDGIDIDYEGKLAATRPYYSAFLKELKAKLGDAILSCTIEPRTPPDSLYTVIPKNLEYANDYDAINKYCDRVNLMTYDQQRADLKLNAARAGAPYYPLADPAWVKKVITLTKQSIDADKLYLGVGTYGRELSLTVSPNKFGPYTQLHSVQNEYALDTAEENGVEPFRNAAGELSYSYVPTATTQKLLSAASLSKGVSGKDEFAARALAYANKTGKTVTVNLVWWSDAAAIAEKVALAKSFGLAGVSIFKIDGQEDDGLWDSL